MSLAITKDVGRIVYKYYIYIGRTKKGELILKSPYQRKVVRIADRRILTSTRKTTQLTETEVRNGEINKGIHVFIQKNGADKYARDFGKYVVVAFAARAIHHVADGMFQNKQSAVYTQLKFVQIEGFYKDGKKVKESCL